MSSRSDMVTLKFKAVSDCMHATYPGGRWAGRAIVVLVAADWAVSAPVAIFNREVLAGGFHQFGVTAAVALGTATIEFYRIEPELVQLSHIALVVDVLLSSFAALCKGVRVSKDRICQSCQCKDWSEW